MLSEKHWIYPLKIANTIHYFNSISMALNLESFKAFYKESINSYVFVARKKSNKLGVCIVCGVKHVIEDDYFKEYSIIKLNREFYFT